jgi:hypothetical protein
VSSPGDPDLLLLEELDDMKDLGEVALTTWAARALGHSKASRALQALRRMEPGRRSYPTVELSWALTAMVIGDSGTVDLGQALPTARALLARFETRPLGRGRRKRQAGVMTYRELCRLCISFQCFAYYLARRTRAAGGARCPNACELRVPTVNGGGTDIRTGRIVERYGL